MTNYGGSFETYTYSADGLRQRKVNASGVTNYLWEGDNIVVETNASSVSLGRYTYGPGRWGLLTSVDRDFPLFYVPDPQGNTRDLVYMYNGTPEDDHYIFKAFGEELGPVGPSNNPYRYNGQWGYYRDILDRMYVQARHYDAIKGRWLSDDPIGLAAGDGNLYRYVDNNPVGQRDPFGKFTLGASAKPNPIVTCVARCASKCGNPTSSGCMSCLLEKCGGAFIKANCRAIVCLIVGKSNPLCGQNGDPCVNKKTRSVDCQNCCEQDWYCCMMENAKDPKAALIKCDNQQTTCECNCPFND